MGMTMTQKILAKHAGLDEVKAGQLTCRPAFCQRRTADRGRPGSGSGQ